MSLHRVHELTIANGGTTSDVLVLGESTRAAILVPVMTGTAITFTASATRGGTYAEVRDASNNAVSLTFTEGDWHELAAELLSHAFVKVVSGSAEGAARTLYVVSKTPT